MNTSINGESSGRTVISEGLDMELDGRFAIRERLLIAVAFTHYNTLQPEGVGHITVGVLLHDDLECRSIPVMKSTMARFRRFSTARMANPKWASCL